MTLIDFVNKYIKTLVDYDGVYGAQCVDLFRQYCYDVLNIPQHTGAVNGAKDLYLKYYTLENEIRERDVFMRLSAINTSGAHPGDVAIWDSSPINGYGHVAIVLQDKPKSLIVFEQNGFKQDGAKITERPKDNLLGYLRKWEN